MTDLKEGFIGRVKDYNNWARVFFTVAYWVVLLHVVVPVTTILTIAQILFKFSTGKLNSNLIVLCQSLIDYTQQIMSFLLFKSNEKPFPFKSFPNLNFSMNEKNDQKESGLKGAPKQKTNVKKKQAKKVAKVKAAKKKVSPKKE